VRLRLLRLMRTAAQRRASCTSAGHARLAEQTSKSDSTPPSFAVPRPIASSCSSCPRLRLPALPATKRPSHPSYGQLRGRPAYMSPSSSLSHERMPLRSLRLSLSCDSKPSTLSIAIALCFALGLRLSAAARCPSDLHHTFLGRITLLLPSGTRPSA
jgi:hypothetical protein